MKRAVKYSAVISAVCIGLFAFSVKPLHLLQNEITADENHINVTEYFTTNKSDHQYFDDSFANNITAGSDRCAFALFNSIPINASAVHANEKKFVVPCGTLFGIKFYAKGVVVIECCKITAGGNEINPGDKCGLIPGDTILEIDGYKIENCGDVERLTAQSGGDEMTLLCLRGSKQFETTIKPACVDGECRLGLWIRDSAAGLGTMTFYDPESGTFASLGHGICDDDTGELLALDRAEITEVGIAGITKGTNGCPGSINGYFQESPSIGSAALNCECGLYGDLKRLPTDFAPIEIADKSEIRKGKAQILCTLDGGMPQLYDIEITSIDHDEKNKTKNLQITATDSRLLAKTGGIVQGMSGSPILQNGKLAGAVTHVLVTNSARGYGIFAQNMYYELEKTRK